LIVDRIYRGAMLLAMLVELFLLAWLVQIERSNAVKPPVGCEGMNPPTAALHLKTTHAKLLN
jgi:hypothetical protein